MIPAYFFDPFLNRSPSVTLYINHSLLDYSSWSAPNFYTSRSLHKPSFLPRTFIALPLSILAPSHPLDLSLNVII